jgi:hypothetical protein
MREFLTGPVLFGRPAYLIGLIHVVLAILVLSVLWAAISKEYRSGWPALRCVFPRNDSGALLVRATFWGYGALLTAITIAGVSSARHYLIVAAPVMALWAAQTVLFAEQRRDVARRFLGLLVLCGGALSLALLDYIHTTGIIHGEYGPTWRSQAVHCPLLDNAHHPECLGSLAGR